MAPSTLAPSPVVPPDPAPERYVSPRFLLERGVWYETGSTETFLPLPGDTNAAFEQRVMQLAQSVSDYELLQGGAIIRIEFLPGPQGGHAAATMDVEYPKRLVPFSRTQDLRPAKAKASMLNSSPRGKRGGSSHN